VPWCDEQGTGLFKLVDSMSVSESIFPTDLVISLTILGGRPTEGSSGQSFGQSSCRTVRGKKNSIITIYVCHRWWNKMAEGGDIL